MRDILVVDVETTGLDQYKNAIVSIGGIVIPKDTKDTIYHFYNEARVWPGAKINDRALEVNGCTREDITSSSIRLTQREMLENLVDFAHLSGDMTIWGHNARFDCEFINTSLQREGIDFGFGHRTLDQHTIAYVRHIDAGLEIPLKDKRSNLGEDPISDFVGIPPEPKPHNALNGAKWEAEAIHRMLYGENFQFEFKKHPVPDYLKRN